MTTDDQWWREEPKRSYQNERRSRKKLMSLDEASGRFQARLLWFYGTVLLALPTALWMDVNHDTFRWLDQQTMQVVHGRWEADRQWAHEKWMEERKAKGLWPFFGPPTPPQYLNELHTDKEGVRPAEKPPDSKAERGQARDD